MAEDSVSPERFERGDDGNGHESDREIAAKTDGLEASRERAWKLLDVLPKGRPHPSLTTTTIEMSAIVTAASARDGRRPETIRWKRPAVAAVLLAASLAAGFVTGSRDRRVPLDAVASAVARHRGVLEEAGSVEFLRTLAARDLPPPRRAGGPRAAGEPEPVPAPPYPELDRAIADFRVAFGLTGDAAEPEAGRRRSGDVPRAAEPFGPPALQVLATTARALAEPDAGPLVEAARRWHQWVLASDPVERRILPTLGTKDRLEWLARRGRQWRPPGARGPFPPPPLDGGRPPFRTPRENRGPAG